MSATREQLFAMFAELGITVTTVEHPPVFTVGEAKKVHDKIPGGHCKNLFCKDEKGEIWLIVALEDAIINLKTAPGKIGSKRLTFGRPDLLMEILGMEPGSVTPFGLINDRQVRTHVVLDQRMMQEQVLNFHPLQNTATTSLASTDLLTFTAACGHKPRVVAVSEPLP